MSLLRIVLPTGDKFKVIWQLLWFNKRNAKYNDDDDDVTSLSSIHHCKIAHSVWVIMSKSVPALANIVVYILSATTHWWNIIIEMYLYWFWRLWAVVNLVYNRCYIYMYETVWDWRFLPDSRVVLLLNDLELEITKCTQTHKMISEISIKI